MSRLFRGVAAAAICIAAMLCFAAVCIADDQPQSATVQQPPTVVLPCAENAPGGAACQPSKNQKKEAKTDFEKALKLQKSGKLQEAFTGFENAARLEPQNAEYVTAREMSRQQLVYDHVQSGNNDLLQSHTVEAMAEFNHALNLDPHNTFAEQQLETAAEQWAPRVHEVPRVLETSGELFVRPKSERSDFHFRGDSRELLKEVAAAYGIKATVDDSVQSRQVRFEVTDVDFHTAMDLAGEVTKTFWSALRPDSIFVTVDNPENHKLYDHMIMRTFYFPGLDKPQDFTDLGNLLRNVFEIQHITPDAEAHTIVVRAPQAKLDAATKLMAGLDDAGPQVMLDVHVYEVSSSYTRNIGVQIPNEFNLFNIPIGALAALGGQSIQDLINQLISGGGINQANSQSLSALLAQLQNQQNSIFSQPLATFGNGSTLMGVSLGTLTAQLSLNDSSATSLEHAMLLASPGNQTTFQMGTRYPILNASFAPILNSPAIAGVIANNSFQAPFPSFSYEDLGLTIKAKPTINDQSTVSMELEMQLRTLLAQSLNGVPVMANREYKGTISLQDGEPAVIAGALSNNEQKSLSGIPGLGFVPGLNQVMTSNSKEIDNDEVLIVITPHIVRDPNHERDAAVWLQ